MSIKSIRERAEAATPGPWAETGRDVDHDILIAQGINPGDACGLGCEVEGPPEPMLRGQFDRHADASFIAHARQDIPALLAVAEAAARMKEHHGGIACAETSSWSDECEAAHEPLRAALAALEDQP